MNFPILRNPEKKTWGLVILSFISLFSILFSFSIISVSGSMTINSDNDDEPDDEDPEITDEDQDDIDDNFEDANQRETQYEISGTSLQIQSELKNSENPDKIDFEIKGEDSGLSINTHYQKDSSDGEIDLEFTIQFISLIEYYDTNQDGFYNQSFDPIKSDLELQNFDSWVHSVLPVNNVQVDFFSISTQDGVFTTEFYLGDGFTSLNQTIITPVELKFAILINNYPFQNSSSNLAMETRFEYEGEVEHDEDTEDEDHGYSDNEEGIKATTPAGNFSGAFTWEQNASIDGINRPVNATALEPVSGEDSEYQMFLSYPKGIVIYHDPKVGIGGVLKSVPPANIPNIPVSTPWWAWLLGFPLWVYVLIALVMGFGLMMTKTEYRDYLLNRFLPLSTGPHSLTMEEVLENEIRSRIINLIIDEPGIHYKELLRRADTSPSNLAWHLDILETYKIIHKQRVGNFLIYYPYLEKNPFADINPKLVKSKVTLEVFQIIGDNPGIQQNQVATRMELNRKTVKYHLDKLKEVILIREQKEGRSVKYYPLQVVKPKSERELKEESEAMDLAKQFASEDGPDHNDLL